MRKLTNLLIAATALVLVQTGLASSDTYTQEQRNASYELCVKYKLAGRDISFNCRDLLKHQVDSLYIMTRLAELTDTAREDHIREQPVEVCQTVDAEGNVTFSGCGDNTFIKNQ